MSRGGFAGLLVVDVRIPGARSLKDKRSPLRSVKQRLRSAGYSVSEVDHHDLHQRAQIAVSIVAAGSSDTEHLLDAARRAFESRPDLEISVRQRTVLGLGDFDA